MAEIYQRRGQMPEALVHYKTRARSSRSTIRISSTRSSASRTWCRRRAARAKAEATPTSIEDLFDFDTLLAQLGGGTQRRSPTSPAADAPADAVSPSALDAVELPADDSDPFALLERQLRESEEQRAHRGSLASAADEQRDRQRVMAELEDWLAAIVTDREQPAVGLMHVAPAHLASRATRGCATTCATPDSTRCSSRRCPNIAYLTGLFASAAGDRDHARSRSR